jgi:hypothetical protein
MGQVHRPLVRRRRIVQVAGHQDGRARPRARGTDGRTSQYAHGSGPHTIAAPNRGGRLRTTEAKSAWVRAPGTPGSPSRAL